MKIFDQTLGGATPPCTLIRNLDRYPFRFLRLYNSMNDIF